MRNPESNSNPDRKLTGGNPRILLALAAISIGTAAGYHYGQESRTREVDDLKADSAVKEQRLDFAERQVKQINRALKKATKNCREQQKRTLVREQQMESPDEAVCIDVVDRALRERTFELAGLLGLTNQNDIDKLIEVMRKGYTKVDGVYNEGKSITLIDPNEDDNEGRKYTSIDLEKPIEEVPAEFLSDFEKVAKSHEELAFEQKIADGELEDAVMDFDLEQIRPDEDNATPEDIAEFEELTKIQSGLSDVSDEEAKKVLFCEFFARMMRAEIEEGIQTEESEEVENENENNKVPDPMEIQRTRLGHLYLQALSEYAGVEDEEECYPYLFQSPAECPPCEPCSLEIGEAEVDEEAESY